MGESIIYRPRFRGSLRRLNFVEGWVTGGTPIPGGVECGDNTLRPLKVTVKQLYEIMYGVKDAWFTSGSAQTFGGSPHGVIGEPAEEDPLVTSGVGWIDERAYSFFAGDTYPYLKHFMKEGYAVPHSLGYGFEADDKERLMFTDIPGTLINQPMAALVDPWRPYIAGGYYYSDLTFRCGFHHLNGSKGYSTSLPADYGFYTNFTSVGADYYSGMEASLVFSGRVAWVDLNNSRDPFDPLNELYIEMNFIFGSGYSGIIAPPYFYSTRVAITSSYQGALGCNLVLQLSNSSVRCPIYYDIPVLVTIGAVSDFVIMAKKWWPYANYDGSPKYDENTGMAP